MYHPSRANYNNYSPPRGDAPTHPYYTLHWAEGSLLTVAALAGPWVFAWLVLRNLCLELISVVKVAFRDPFSFVNRKSRPGDEKFPNTPSASPHRTPA